MLRGTNRFLITLPDGNAPAAHRNRRDHRHPLRDHESRGRHRRLSSTSGTVVHAPERRAVAALVHREEFGVDTECEGLFPVSASQHLYRIVRKR